MNLELLNKQLVDAIKKNYSEGAHIASDLMDVLYLGKEAVYRRLRHEVPFTFSEAAILSKKLGISLDKIVSHTLSDNIFFELKEVDLTEPSDNDYQSLDKYYNVLKSAAADNQSEVAYASNLLPRHYISKYNHLLMFDSFKWVYYHKSNEIKPYSKIEVPPDFLAFRKKVALEMLNIRNTCYILDSSIFSSVVSEIKYFRSVNLLREEDIAMLKEELLMFLDELNEIAENGSFKNGNRVQVFVSNTRIDATYSYFKAQHYTASMLGSFALNSMIALEEITYNKVRKWIQTLKKTSTLISESGEIQRIQFFKKQKEYISNL